MAPIDSALACDPLGADAATGGFGRWYALQGGTFSAGTAIAALALVTGDVALFGVDTRGNVLTARATHPIASAAWSAWSLIPGTAGALAPGTPIAAIARGSRIDLFAVDNNGALVTLADGTSNGWAPVATNAPPFRPQRPAVVARDIDHVEVFAIANGEVYASEQSTGQAFSAWSVISEHDAGAAPFPDTSSVSAISRSSTSVDVFALANDSLLYTTSGSYASQVADWLPWSPLANMTFPVGALGVPVSRVADQWDLFVVDGYGAVYSILHNFSVPPPPTTDSGWYGWYPLSGPIVASGTRVAAIAESAWRISLYLHDKQGALKTTSWPGWGGPWIPMSLCGDSFAATSLEAVLAADGTMAAVAVDDRGAAITSVRPAN